MIEQAIAIAENATDFRQRVGCVVTDKRGRVISAGFNIRKTHPLQYKHARRVGIDSFYLHAEVAALVKCRKQPYAIFVGRLKRTGEIGLAKPCPICTSAIIEAGVKEIHYTTNKGTVETILVEELA